MTKRGLVIGRFQPPHLGHLSVIKEVLKQQDEVIIVVAAAQLSHTKKNPLTAGERVTLIRLMLESENIDPTKFWIIPAQDIMDNPLWVHHIKRLVPKFDIFYSNNPFTKMLFEEAGFEVKITGIINRGKYEGTKIRSDFIHDKDVSGSLNSEVVKLLNLWKIKDRLLAVQDENPVADLV
ncbi:MAG: nicotinamide-nucleotide adenylyltransferase [Candidatus Heimdallarchaeota archaeon]|nr:nicotinamide-nucleotide adenylyltransferase [Candidatus Heimdallarchaeota archaeon]